MSARDAPGDAIEVARHLAGALEARGLEYALGGALALGFWGTPRGTLDVDLTLFLSPEQPGECIRALQKIRPDSAGAGRIPEGMPACRRQSHESPVLAPLRGTAASRVPEQVVSLRSTTG